jgi:hypothetical protein
MQGSSEIWSNNGSNVNGRLILRCRDSSRRNTRKSRLCMIVQMGHDNSNSHYYVFVDGLLFDYYTQIVHRKTVDLVRSSSSLEAFPPSSSNNGQAGYVEGHRLNQGRRRPNQDRTDRSANPQTHQEHPAISLAAPLRPVLPAYLCIPTKKTRTRPIPLAQVLRPCSRIDLLCKTKNNKLFIHNSHDQTERQMHSLVRSNQKWHPLANHERTLKQDLGCLVTCT